jgi:AraC family transcriptional regulator, transcriptional activator of pobA
MPEKPLPIYQIQDFAETARPAPNFYLNRFEAHLQQHAFIQKPHKHNFYIVLLITQGSGTHTIDFKTYPVSPQTVFFLSPGQVHAWQLAADTAGYILFFNPEFYQLVPPQGQFYRFPFFNTLVPQPTLTLPANQAAPVTAILENMAAEHNGQLPQWESTVASYLNILLIVLARVYSKQYGQPQLSAPVYSAWEQLQDLLEQHYKQHQPVSFYADKMHLTPKQLNDLSKNTWGKTVTELLQDRVILEARRLLTHSALTITQVAAELGYFDNSYFSRFFKKHTDQTPESFRQSNL